MRGTGGRTETGRRRVAGASGSKDRTADLLRDIPCRGLPLESPLGRAPPPARGEQEGGREAHQAQPCRWHGLKIRMALG